MNHNELVSYIEHLLTAYRSDLRKRNLLRFEMTHSRDISDEEVLGAMAFAKSDSIGSSSGYISDKTFYIAANYQEKAEQLNRERVTSISGELVRLEQKLARLDYCVSQLAPNQASAVRGLYYENKDLKTLAIELHISERTVQRYRDSAIEELATMYETLQNAGVVFPK